MASWNHHRPTPTIISAVAASVVSEHRFTASTSAQDDGPEGEVIPMKSSFGLSVRNKSNAMWRSDLWSGASSGGGLYKNWDLELQLIGLGGQQSFIEGHESARLQTTRTSPIRSSSSCTRVDQKLSGEHQLFDGMHTRPVSNHNLVVNSKS